MSFLRSLMMVLLLAPSAFCFELKVVEEISSTAYLKWQLADDPIGISLNRRGSNDLQFSKVEEALVGALDAWQNVPRQSMQFEYSGATNLHSTGTDQMNSVEWVESGWEYSSNALAVTSYSYYLEDPPTLVDADIFMNGQDYSWSAGDQNGIDVESILLHEIGHVLGISHSSVVNARMFPYASGSQSAKLSKDDKEGLRFLYGLSKSSFVLLTPIGKSRYVSNISANGLPLPVFRWTPGPVESYVIEFSNSPAFAKLIQIHVGADPFYALSSEMEKKLLKISLEDKVFWRVRGGTFVTPTRSFRFIS